MNYQEMWERLKSLVEDDLKWHQSGIAQSVGESIHGEQKCREILRDMRTLEEEYKDE